MNREDGHARWRSLVTRRLPLLAVSALAAHPLVAFFAAPTPLVLRCLVGAELLATLARPSVGWLALIAVVPFGDLIGRAAGRPWMGAAWSATEPLVLAFLVGWLIRRAVDPGPRDAAGESGSLLARWLAALFGFAALCSLAVQLLVLQVSTAFPVDFLSFVLRFLWHDYYANPALLPAVPGTVFVLEGVGLFTATLLLTARTPVLARKGAVVFAGAAAVVAVVNLGEASRLIAVDPAGMTLQGVLMLRVSHAFPDVNAAGSYFVLSLFGMAGLSVSDRRRRWVWGAAVLLAVVGLWLSGSRAAFSAAPVAVLWLAGLLALRGRLRARVLLPVLLALVVLAAGGYLVARQTPARHPRMAVQWRTEMAATALRMFRDYPAFGIGAGRFYALSLDYSNPERRPAAHENAHNNFLQVLAELGLGGFLSLTFLVAIVLLGARRLAQPGEEWALGLATGGVGFVVTWLAGHPMLVREVALAFWVSLGLVAARGAAASPVAGGRSTWTRRLLGATALVMLALVPFVAERRLAALDLTRDGRGVSQWHKAADGVRFRWMLDRAVVFVPANARVVAIGVRSPGGAATVRAAVKGRTVGQFVVSGEPWQEILIDVPGDYGWKSMPVALTVRSRERRPGSMAVADDRLQVALPRVVR